MYIIFTRHALMALYNNTRATRLLTRGAVRTHTHHANLYTLLYTLLSRHEMFGKINAIHLSEFTIILLL